jgi:hypothetical protein
MRAGPFAVITARADLAVESGFERMAEVQEEIPWICEEAHTPVIRQRLARERSYTTNSLVGRFTFLP